ncbi:MAG TPA: ABC transporter permease [Ktedonobacteraceae bacterium]|nr:ABC transporter permease [Ktedonobacteraceae bacterium]
MRLLYVVLKDLKIVLKDWGSLIILFVSPLMFIIVLSLALGQSFANLNTSNAINVLLVNDDPTGSLSQKFVTGLTNASNAGHLQFVQKVSGTTLTDAGAEQLVKNGSYTMALLIPAHFSTNITHGQNVTVRFIADPAASQQVVKPVQALVEAVLGQTVGPFTMRQSVSNALARSVPPQAAAQINQEVTMALAKPAPAIATVQESNPPGVSVPKYPSVYQQNVPGYTIMYIFFIVGVMATSVLQERRDGTFRRLLVSPVSKITLLLGKLLPYYIICLLQAVILFAIGKFVFGMDLGPHPVALVGITLAIAACAVSLGLLISAFVKNEGQANGLSTIIVLVLAAFGGCMVPPVFMPSFMTQLARLTPQGWALLGYQDVMVRGVNLVGTLPTVGALLAFAAVFFIVGVSRFRFN